MGKKYEHLRDLAQLNPTHIGIQGLWNIYNSNMGDANENFDQNLFFINVYQPNYGSGGGAYDPQWEVINETVKEPWWGSKEDIINCN